jgi:RNA polymerase sigma-70 factor (ECF subfamily)
MNLHKVPEMRPQLSLLQGGSYAGRTDAELIVLCQKKDSRAFEELIKRHQRTVYALLYRLAPDWNDTSDLAQEVFIRMWRSIGNLRNPSAFRSWLSQIVTNLFYDELRKRPRQLPTISMDEPLDSEEGGDSTTRDIKDKSAGPDELCQRKEMTEVVRQAMTRLPEQFRTAIILREFEGLSYEEIALITNTEIGTVKSRIARARAKIQEMVSPYLKAA